MTIHTTLTKRRAKYQGEVGFFPDNEMAQQDIAIATMGEEVMCSFSRPRNLEQLKYLWALVHKVSDNSDRWLDKVRSHERTEAAGRLRQAGVRQRDP